MKKEEIQQKLQESKKNIDEYFEILTSTAGLMDLEGKATMLFVGFNNLEQLAKNIESGDEKTIPSFFEALGIIVFAQKLIEEVEKED
jgi:hypothetical protein